MSNHPAGREFASRVSISDVSSVDFQEISTISRSIAFKKGDTVMDRGMQPLSVYFVERGAVEVSYMTGETRIVVALIGEGELFGETAFFDGVSRVRTVKATEASVLRVWERDVVESIREDKPALYGKFIHWVAQSICVKFRRVLEEREPLTAYAASLSTGRRTFMESRQLPENFTQSEHWSTVSRMVEQFKSAFFDLTYELQRDTSEEVAPVRRERCHELLSTFNEKLQEFRDMMGDSPMAEYFWGFIFKEIFPYFMRSRFAERAFYKPKGYAGDFLMMEMIYRNIPEGDGKIGRLIDEWCLKTSAAEAVRKRRELLCTLLGTWCQRLLKPDRPVRILNLACGSNRELFDFLGSFPATERVEALCVDADSEALEFTNREVNVFPHRAVIRLMQDNVVKWALGRVRHSFGPMDIIYSSGLTDYLDRRLFEALITRCYEHLSKGGVLIVGNFGDHNPNRAFMDHLLQWKLIHRQGTELKRIFSATPFGKNANIISEATRVNLFAVATREEGNGGA